MPVYFVSVDDDADIDDIAEEIDRMIAGGVRVVRRKRVFEMDTPVEDEAEAVREIRGVSSVSTDDEKVVDEP